MGESLMWQLDSEVRDPSSKSSVAQTTTYYHNQKNIHLGFILKEFLWGLLAFLLVVLMLIMQFIHIHAVFIDN